MPDMLTYVFRHAWPPIQPIYSLLGLSTTQMTTVWAVMQLFQALLSEVLTVRNGQSVYMPPETGSLSALALITGR